jgi:hypothetical protein
MVLDARTDASVDLVVGSRYDEALDVSQVSAGPLTNAPGCRDAARLHPKPAPTVSPTGTISPTDADNENVPDTAGDNDTGDTDTASPEDTSTPTG